MRRLALACLLFCLASLAQASACPQYYAFGQAPVITKAALKPRSQELCFRAFAVMHSGLSRTPLWSAEHLLRASVEAAETLVRRDSFHAEPALRASDRAELSDFARSGFDRGHLSPNGDMPDPASQGESFSLANIVPQVHANNAGIWAGIESAVRQLALREGDLYVVTGPAFVGDEIPSLKGRVLVPTHLWKVVYSPQRRQAGVYLVTNDETRTYSALTVSELERMIGIQALPGVPQRVRDTPMELPVPTSQHVAGKKKPRAGPQGSDTGEFSLGEFARRTVEKLLRSLAH